MNRLDSGAVRLYTILTVLTIPTTIRNGITSFGGSAKFIDYYVIRDNEPAAKVYATISTFNNNQTFKAKAPLYFADYLELTAKIKTKVVFAGVYNRVEVWDEEAWEKYKDQVTKNADQMAEKLGEIGAI